MNRFLYILAGFVVVNLIFLVIPSLVPRLPGELLAPYQLWTNALVLFVLLLPGSIGNFKILYNMKN